MEDVNIAIGEAYKAGEVAGYTMGLEMREPYLEGIRKVVEFVDKNWRDYHFHDLWQSFKKEIGE